MLGGYGLPAPLGKLCVCALDVVAARNMVAGTQAVIDAGGGVIVGLGHAALFHNRVGQRDGRQQAPGVGVDGMLKDLLGDAEVMVAGGTESCITPLGIAGFTSLTALTSSDDPKHASIPFDKNRKGFVLGEGAGVVVLEELEHAKARGAHIYAEVVGYGATADAFHITSPCEDGSGAAKAMELAMTEAKAAPEEITYINAHGTGTHHNDLFETRAIKLAFGEAAKNVCINSTKSMTGHLLGAAGGVEFVVCAKSVEEGYIHQTMGTKETDEECDLDYTIGAPKEKDVVYAMSNSLGFGGHNASILIKKYENA